MIMQSGTGEGRGSACSRSGVMSALEQDCGRADLRRERSHGGRSERSRGNMPILCLQGFSMLV